MLEEREGDDLNTSLTLTSKVKPKRSYWRYLFSRWWFWLIFVMTFLIDYFEPKSWAEFIGIVIGNYIIATVIASIISYFTIRRRKKLLVRDR